MLNNWYTLNKKVFSKLGLELSNDEIDNIINWKDKYVENLLCTLYVLVY